MRTAPVWLAFLVLTGAGAVDRADGGSAPGADQLAAAILRAAGTTKGLCLDLGCGDGRLALELARRSEMFVHGRSPRESEVTEARRVLAAAGLYGRRAAVEQGGLGRLPYPDYCANLVVRGDLLRSGLHPSAWSWSEVVRVLRPGGLAYIGQAGDTRLAEPLTAAELRKELAEAGIREVEVIERDGVWATFRRPPLEGVGQWSHGVVAGPGGNPCVDDGRVKAPFHTLWIGGPLDFTKFGIPLISNGRVLLRHGGFTNTGRWTAPREGDLIQAFDAYNGALLWERRMTERVGRGFVAVGEGVYAAAGTTLYALDAADGAVRWKCSPDSVADGMKDWGAYACSDAVLVAALYDEPIAPEAENDARRLRALAGLAVKDARVLWKVLPEAGVGAFALGEGRAFYLSPGKHLAALNIATGKEQWNIPVTEGGGLRYHQGRLYSSGAVYSAGDGKLVRRGPTGGVLIGDRAYSGRLKGVSVVDLNTGKPLQPFPAPRDPYCPKTGIPDGCPYMYGRCITTTGSTHCYFFSYSGTAIADLTRNEVFPAEAFRSNCRTGVIAGNGLVYNSPSGCGCAFTVRGGVALVPVGESLYWARPDSAPPPQLENGPAFDEKIPAVKNLDDWPCYRGDAARSNVTAAAVRVPMKAAWRRQLRGTITPPAAAGGMVFVGSDDHSVTALDSATGEPRWSYVTGGEVWVTPACWEGRVYVGSQDGWVYCLRADNGRLVWRFRGAPHERKMMFFGRLQSLWPIGGGVLVDKGVAYFYAGLCSHDRVFVYALDAETGRVLWKNDQSGLAVKVTGPEGGISPYGLSPSGVLAASEDTLYVPHGMFAPAAFRRSDGALLWWGRRGDSKQRSNIEVQNLGGPNLSLGGGLLFVGGPDRVTASAQPFVAVDAKTGRMWGADEPALFEKAGRDAAGKSVVVARSVFGTKAIQFGQGIAPVVADGGVFTFGWRGGFRDLTKFCRTQFGPVSEKMEKWAGPVPAGTLIVADDKVVVANGKVCVVLSRRSGAELWRGATGAEGDALANGLAAAGGRVFLATAKSEVVCFGAE